ncbi:MAG TPA: energy transducer TonB [Terriglobia bacterium]|nr:energy transducer TonB [Terriglobia bacterium]
MSTLILSLLLAHTVAPVAEHSCIHRTVLPEYPPLARMARITGTVNLDVEIGSDGMVLSAKASSGHPLLVRAAEKSILEWSFYVPSAMKHFPIHQTMVFIYKIEGEETYSEFCPTVTLRPPNLVEIVIPPAQPETNTSDHR